MDVRGKTTNDERLIDAIDAWNRRAGEEKQHEAL